MYINYKQLNWVALLLSAEYAYNSKVYSRSRHSLIYLAYGVPFKGFNGIKDNAVLKARPYVAA